MIASQGVLEPGARLLEKPLSRDGLARNVREAWDAPQARPRRFSPPHRFARTSMR